MSASRSGLPGWSVQIQNMVGDLNEYEHGHYPQNGVGDFQLNEYMNMATDWMKAYHRNFAQAHVV